MKKYQTHIIWAIIAVIALGGGFFWGKSTASTAARAGFAGAGGTFSSSTRARFGGGAGGASGGFTVGQITAVTPESMTLQLTNGNSEVVLYSSSTAVTEPTSVSAANLTVGTNVMVAGTSNSDGSVTATTIQVRPVTAGAGSGTGTSAGAGQ